MNISLSPDSGVLEPGSRVLVRCPAKINRFLRVEAPDASGYHPLETEFQAIGLFDDLIITPEPSAGTPLLTIEGPEADGLDPEDRNNTVLKALRLMREVATLPRLSLHLIKRIPSQAGLGGGSSDAAGLIRGLRKILPPIVPNRDFEMVARGVGADVSFFLVGGRAYGEGYGEKLSPLEDQPVQSVVIALPHARCSTPEMYRKLDTLRQGGPTEALPYRLAENSFHDVAPLECLQVLLRFLDFGLTDVALAGSGAAVFGFAETPLAALSVVAALSELSIPAWQTTTLSRAESLEVRVLGPS